MQINNNFTIINNKVYQLTQIENSWYISYEGTEKLDGFNNYKDNHFIKAIPSESITNSFYQKAIAYIGNTGFLIVSEFPTGIFNLFTDEKDLASKNGFNMVGQFEFYKECSLDEIDSICLLRTISKLPYPYPIGLPDREVIYKTKK